MPRITATLSIVDGEYVRNFNVIPEHHIEYTKENAILELNSVITYITLSPHYGLISEPDMVSIKDEFIGNKLLMGDK